MGKFIEDFKAFALKGNVVDMAVGVIVGGAFGKIVTSVVNDIIMPPIGLLVGGVDFSDMKLEMKKAVLDAAGEVVSPAVTWNYGAFIQQVVDFTILAFCVFILVKLINSLNKKKEAPAPAPAPAPEPQPSKEEVLLTEIRDLLKERK